MLSSGDRLLKLKKLAYPGRSIYRTNRQYAKEGNWQGQPDQGQHLSVTDQKS